MEAHVRLNSAQLRTLAHPLRARLLGELRLRGRATATDLARVLATNTGATSYHLRQLADVGLVREDNEPGSGRRRYWLPAHASHGWTRADFEGSPDDEAASDWLTGFGFRASAERAEAWNSAQSTYPPQWRDAAEFSDYLLELAPAQLKALLADLSAVVHRHRAQPATPGADARRVYLSVQGFPLVEEEENR
jgi:DNA-binding transcriptional ArsR family regulator